MSDILLDRSRPDKKRAPTIVEPDTVLTDQGGVDGTMNVHREAIDHDEVRSLCDDTQSAGGAVTTAARV